MRAEQLAGAGISAVEAHEGVGELIIELALDGLVIHIMRNRIIDIQQRGLVSADAQTDVLREGSVDINLAGDRNSPSHETAVDIAWNELEHVLEGRPALSGQRDILSVSLVLLDPVKQRQLVSRKLLQHRWLLALCIPHLLRHIRDDLRDSLVVLVLLIGLKQIQLGLFLNLDIQVVELLDRCIACQEIRRSRSEGNDLQVAQSVRDPCNRKEVVDHIRALLSISDRIVRNIRVDVAKGNIVAGVQHTAVCISASVHQILLALLCRRAEHLRSVKMLCEKGLGDLRSEVAEENTQCIAACFFDILQRIHHIDFALNDGDRTLVDVVLIILLLICLDERLSSVDSKRRREAVARNRDDANLDLRNV